MSVVENFGRIIAFWKVYVFKAPLTLKEMIKTAIQAPTELDFTKGGQMRSKGFCTIFFHACWRALDFWLREFLFKAFAFLVKATFALMK